MIPGMQEINDDARALREAIDAHHDRLIDLFGGIEAEKQTNPLYDAVTRLHELAASAVRANQAKGIGS